MRPRKQAVFSAGTAEFPGIVEGPSLFRDSGIQTGCGGRSIWTRSRQLRRDPRLNRRQGLNILARDVENMTARLVPISQADWLWDCTTPHTALAGSSVPASAIVFLRKSLRVASHFAGTEPSRSIALALQGYGFPPCRQRSEKVWTLVPEAKFPRRLKPCELSNVNGTPEGVSLQIRYNANAIASGAADRLPRTFVFERRSQQAH